MGDASGEQADQSKIRVFLKACQVQFAVCGRTLSLWKMSAGIIFMKGLTTGFTIFSTYRHAIIVPRTITVPVLPSYAIAPHTIISRVRQICLLSISDGCALSLIRLRTCLRRSDYFKRRSDWTRQWTSQNATISVALHQTSFFCLCGCAKSTHCTGTRARSPSASNLFPLVRGNKYSACNCFQTPVAVIRLFATVTLTIRRYSFAVVHLERPVPGLLATLFWFRLCTTFFTGTALQPTLWAMWLYDAPVSLMPVIRPFSKSDRWR